MSIKDVISGFFRGSFLTWMLCLGLNVDGVTYMVKLYGVALKYMFVSSDAKWKPVPDAGAAFDSADGEIERRQIIMIRHGESMWNETFNGSKMPLFFAGRVVKAVLYEMYLLATGCDSWFYDSPLNSLGHTQCTQFAEGIKGTPTDPVTAEDFAILNGESTKQSVIVSSNLRRAMSTVLIGLQSRLARTEERVLILPQLQEISRNIDTMSISAPHTAPVLAFNEEDSKVIDFKHGYATGFDVSANTGNKTVEANGLQRIQTFAKWAFDQPAEAVIAGGHSLYFKHFMRTYLPAARSGLTKLATEKKISNGGAVSCDLLRKVAPDGSVVYKLDPASLRIVFGGFK